MLLLRDGPYSFLHLDSAIIKGHTVIREDLKGDIPSVLKIIPQEFGGSPL